MLDALKLVLALAAILGFVLLFGFGIIQTWKTKAPPPPTFSDAYVSVATALAALVGGVVAIAFHQKLAHQSFAELITDPRNQLVNVCALSYVVLGLGAVVTWVTKSSVTPPLVKNLATTFLGLAVAIVTAFFASP